MSDEVENTDNQQEGTVQEQQAGQGQEQHVEQKGQQAQDAGGKQPDPQGRNTLILLDTEKGTFRILAGKDENGNVKAGAENDANGPFAQMEQGDLIDQFMKNYRRQSNYPTGLKFLWTPLNAVKDISKKFLANVQKGSKDLLDGIKQYAVREKSGLAAEEIDWKKVEALSGMNEEYLKKQGVGEALERGEQSKMLYVNGNVDDCKITGSATLSATRNPETMKPKYRVNGLCNERVLDLKFNGYSFSPDDKKVLTGEKRDNIKALLTDPKTKEQYYAVIGLNPETNAPVAYRYSAIQVPKMTKGVKWDEAMQQDYRDGKTVRVEGCKGPYGTYSADVKFDPYKKGMDFKPVKASKQDQTQDGNKVMGNEKAKNEQQKQASKQQGQDLGHDMKGKSKEEVGIKAEGPVADALKHNKDNEKKPGVKRKR